NRNCVFFQAEDGIRDFHVTGVQTCALPILITAAHDVSDGGLWTTLVEMGMPNGLGFDIVTDSEIRPDAFLFGEGQGRVVVTITEDHEDGFLDLMRLSKVPFILLGHVTKGKLMVDDDSFGFIADAGAVYERAIPAIMDEDRTPGRVPAGRAISSFGRQSAGVAAECGDRSGIRASMLSATAS